MEAAVDASSTWGGPSATVSAPQASASAAGPVSRGYREEMEDFAFCVRQWDPKVGYTDKSKRWLPLCHGEVAMVDAIIALTANQAMRKRQRNSPDGVQQTAATERQDRRSRQLWYNGVTGQPWYNG